MGSSSDMSQQALEIINQYIEPNSHLLSMERIHRALFQEDLEFNRWEEVRELYSGIEWTEEELRDLAIQAKKIVEQGSSDLSEAYFRIRPEGMSSEEVRGYLDQYTYSPEAEGGEREGFQFSVSGDEIVGNLIYVDIDKEILHTGEVSTLVKEGSIPFRIQPHHDLLIIESTTVTDIQKLKGVVGDKTELELSPILQRTRIEEDFIANMDSWDNPELRHLNTISMSNPGVDSEIQEVEFHMDIPTITHNNLVTERLNEGWNIQKIVVSLFFEGDVYKAVMRSSEMMTYVKISNISDMEDASELMAILRDRFLHHQV